jgi:hypothetical protein
MDHTAYPLDDSDEIEIDSSDDESEECLPAVHGPPASHILETVAAAGSNVVLKPEGSAESNELPSGQNDTIMTARAYQLEMLAESLKRNVIVTVRGSLPNK